MTTAHHTSLLFGGPLSQAAMEAPLSQLDAAIEAVILSGSGQSTTLTAQANSGQASLVVASSTGFAIGQFVYIGSGATFEGRTILAVPDTTHITVSVNLTNTYAIGSPVSRSPVEIVEARNGSTSLNARLSLFDRWAYDARKYGALGDGAADDVASINSAIDAANAAGGGTVFLSPGNYKILSQIVLKTGVILAGAGPGTLITSTQGTAANDAVRAVGTVAAGHVLAADGVKGATSITTSAGGGASYAAGNLVAIQSELQALEGTGHKKADLYRVTSVAGDVVTIDGNLLDTYAIADTAKIRLVTAVERVGVRDLRMVNTRYTSATTTATGPHLRFELAADIWVSGVELEQNNGKGIMVASVLGARIENSRIEELRDDVANSIFGYGVSIEHASRMVTVSGCTMRLCRHGFTTATSASSAMPNYGVQRAITVSGCTVSDTTDVGIDTHEDTDGITITGNAISGSTQQGIQIRAYRAVVSGNTVQGVRGIGINVDTSGDHALIVGNHVYGTMLSPTSTNGYGIWIGGPAAVVGNYVSFSAAHGIFQSLNFAGVHIVGNMVLNNGQSSALAFDGINISGNPTRLVITGNTCTDTQTSKTQRYGIRTEAASTSLTSIVALNDCENNGTGPTFFGAGSPQTFGNSGATAAGFTQRVRGTTTGSVAASGTADVVVTFPTSFTDTNYNVQVSCLEATGALEARTVKTKANGTVTITVKNSDAVTARTGALDVVAIHD